MVLQDLRALRQAGDCDGVSHQQGRLLGLQLHAQVAADARPPVDDVLFAVVLLAVDHGLADVGAGGEHAQSAPLAVVRAGHRLLGVHVQQRHVGSGVGHPALDLHLLVVGEHVVPERHRRRHKGNFWICSHGDRIQSNKRQTG